MRSPAVSRLGPPIVLGQSRRKTLGTGRHPRRDRRPPSRHVAPRPPSARLDCRANLAECEPEPGQQTRTPLARHQAIGLLPAAARHLCANSPGRESGHATVARPRRLPDIFARIARLLLALGMQASQLGFFPLESLRLPLPLAAMQTLLRPRRPSRTPRAILP